MSELFVMHHSTCARKALFVVLEKDLLREGTGLVSREVARDHLRSPEYRALNPDGVVPTLVTDGGEVLVESSVIMRFLDETFADLPLQPKPPLARAQMNLWLKHVDEKYFPALQAITVAVFMRKMFAGAVPGSVDEARLQAMLEALTDYGLRLMREDAIRTGPESRWVTEGLAQLKAMLDRMETALADQPFLVGSELSLADCAVTPLILRLEEFGLADAWKQGRPKLAAWWASIAARPTVQQLVGLADQALLRELYTSIGDARPSYLAAISAR